MPIVSLKKLYENIINTAAITIDGKIITKNPAANCAGFGYSAYSFNFFI